MSSLRAKCDNRDRCGQTGHYLTPEGYVRCNCLQLEMNQRKLGQMFCENPKAKTPLLGKTETNIRIEGPLNTVRPHVAGALLHMSASRKSYVIMDAYRLIEIFLEKDEEYSTSRPAIEADLLVILLGFGDPPNRYLPELLTQVMNRRDLTRKPTWIIMGIELSRVGHKYNADLQAMLENYERIATR